MPSRLTGRGGLASTYKGDRAAILREQYIKALRRRGMRVADPSGAWTAHEPDGRVGNDVVIPYANELRNNRWFFHVQARIIDEIEDTPYVVLLCEKKDGELIDLVLPPGRARNILRRATRVTGKHDGIKINVHMRREPIEGSDEMGERWYLLLPPEERLDVTKYIGRWNISTAEEQQEEELEELSA